VSLVKQKDVISFWLTYMLTAYREYSVGVGGVTMGAIERPLNYFTNLYYKK
jgi:hypothetical protein